MDLSLSKIFLPTLDKARSLRFLTSIFECEVLLDEQDIEFTQIGATNLYFLQTNSPLESQFPFCSFKVQEIEQLDFIKSKIEFFCYREELEILPIKKSQDALEFMDPDGNLWKIEYSALEYSDNAPIM